MRQFGFIQVGRPLFFPRNSTIFIQGDAADRLYFLLKGVARLSFFLSSSGEDKTVCFKRAGRFLGESAVLLGKPYGTTATAWTDCHTVVYDKATAHELIGRDTDFARALALSLSANLWDLGYHLLGNAAPDSTTRVAYALLSLCYQLQPDCRANIELPITHDQLAAFVSLTRVSVSKSLAILEDDGVVKKGKKNLLIPSKDALRHWLREANFP